MGLKTEAIAMAEKAAAQYELSQLKKKQEDKDYRDKVMRMALETKFPGFVPEKVEDFDAWIDGIHVRKEASMNNNNFRVIRPCSKCGEDTQTDSFFNLEGLGRALLDKSEANFNEYSDRFHQCPKPEGEEVAPVVPVEASFDVSDTEKALIIALRHHIAANAYYGG